MFSASAWNPNRYATGQARTESESGVGGMRRHAQDPRQAAGLGTALSHKGPVRWNAGVFASLSVGNNAEQSGVSTAYSQGWLISLTILLCCFCCFGILTWPRCKCIQWGFAYDVCVRVRARVCARKSTHVLGKAHHVVLRASAQMKNEEPRNRRKLHEKHCLRKIYKPFIKPVLLFYIQCNSSSIPSHMDLQAHKTMIARYAVFSYSDSVLWQLMAILQLVCFIMLQLALFLA